VLELRIVVDEIVDLLERVDGDVDRQKRDYADYEDAHELLEQVSVVDSSGHLALRRRLRG
jgi:hypothetical protein